MSQHKYNSQQMLFVKNVPQESATRIVGLYTKYKPLETKNLFPISRITTFLIVLPNIGATEQALHETEGLRVGNTVLLVERYNSKQSIVSRRDARKKRSNFPDGRTNYDYDEEDDFDGHDDEEEEVQVSMKATKIVAKQTEAEKEVTPPRTRRVSESGGISWANVASSTQSDQHSPSPAPPAKVDTLQFHLGESELLLGLRQENRSGSAEDLSRSPAMEGRRKAIPPPPGLSVRVTATPQRQSPPQIVVTPATAPFILSQVIHHQPSTSTQSYDYFDTVPEGRTPMRHTQTHSSSSTRIEKDSSQQTQPPGLQQMRRSSLAMPSDTTAFIVKKHCANCVFCDMRTRGQSRVFHNMNN